MNFLTRSKVIFCLITTLQFAQTRFFKVIIVFLFSNYFIVWYVGEKIEKTLIYLKADFLRPFEQWEAGGVAEVERFIHTHSHTHTTCFVFSNSPRSHRNHYDSELALIGCQCSESLTAETTQKPSAHTSTWCGHHVSLNCRVLRAVSAV